MSDTTDLTQAVLDRLGRQIGDLVVQLAVKDAQVEELQARLQVQQTNDTG